MNPNPYQDELPSRIQLLLCNQTLSNFTQNTTVSSFLNTETNTFQQQSGASFQPFDNNQRKGAKSQRRIEKEREYFERQKRMETTLNARKASRKVCTYFVQGNCQKGHDCTFSHENAKTM